MKKEAIIDMVMTVLLLAALIGSILFALSEKKKNEEFRSSQRATLDSLLKLESIDFGCMYCGKKNHITLLWVKDSIK